MAEKGVAIKMQNFYDCITDFIFIEDAPQKQILFLCRGEIILILQGMQQSCIVRAMRLISCHQENTASQKADLSMRLRIPRSRSTLRQSVTICVIFFCGKVCPSQRSFGRMRQRTHTKMRFIHEKSCADLVFP